MPIAKSAPSSPVVQVESTKPATAISDFLYDGVDVSMYNFFGVDMKDATEADKARLKDIYEWAIDGGKTLGDGMLRIRNLETQLGQPPIGMTRINKLWNWVKISKQIGELQKRQDALENRRSYA